MIVFYIQNLNKLEPYMVATFGECRRIRVDEDRCRLDSDRRGALIVVSATYAHKRHHQGPPVAETMINT
jgi:hypothetical protein